MHSLYNVIKKNFKKAIHYLGWEIIRYNVDNSEEVLLQTILEYFNIRTTIDVGANEGQYALGILQQGYKHKIYSFEPIREVYEKLKANSVGYKQWKTFNLGMGGKPGELTMNISENFVSSSILKVEDIALKAQPQTRIVKQQVVKLIIIDDFFLAEEHDFEGEILLKLDVQGYELEALQGAIKSLPRIRLIQAELSFVPVYKGSPLFKDVVSFLEENNFEIYTIIPGFRDAKTGRMLQADGIFVRKN